MSLVLLFKATVALAAAAAALWILTQVVSRFGTKAAGALAAFPAITAIALLLVAFQSGGQAAAQAASAIPLAMAFEAVSFTALCYLLPRGFPCALSAGLLIWFLLASAALSFGPSGLALNCCFFLSALILCFYLLEHALKIRSRDGATRLRGLKENALRLALASAIIALSVYLGSTDNPFLAGLMSSFPALPLATLVSTHRPDDPLLTLALAKSLVLNGMLNMGGYGIAAWFFYSCCSVTSASFAVIAFTGVLSVCSYFFMRHLVS